MKGLSIIVFIILLIVMILGINSFFLPRLRRENSTERNRILININKDWKYYKEDLIGAEEYSFDDFDWEKNDLPHTWNAKDAFDDIPGYKRGIGWYRKHFTISQSHNSKQIFIKFEGAHQVAEVWLNGNWIGKHIGGYTAFAFDLTPYLKFDKENILAVRVDSSYDEDIPPVWLGHTRYGGIYRDAWLIITNKLHLATLDYASQGVYISTPSVTSNSATIEIKTKVKSHANLPKDTNLITQVLDKSDKVISTLESKPVTLPPNATYEFIQRCEVKKPNLWSPSNPYLYKVRASLYSNSKLVDSSAHFFGIRYYSFDPDKGFFLNGEHLKLRGTTRCQDFEGLGCALPNSIHQSDMKKIKEMGCNFVRLSHYPQDPAVLESCDELGLLVWEEIPVVNHITNSVAFTKNAKEMLKEMIRQHYNHPSIVIWGYMNEPLLWGHKGRLGYLPSHNPPDPTPLAKELDKLAHLEDPFRKTAMALCMFPKVNNLGLADVPDVVGYNRYFGWYYGNLSDLGPFLDEEHENYPNRIIMISEYGAGSDIKIHTDKPKKFDFSEEYQCRFHESYLEQINSRHYLAGACIWNQFDFGDEVKGNTIPHVNQKGMLTMDRKEKDVFYFYKSQWSDEPVLYIVSHHWQVHRASETKGVVVYTNCDSVELFLNNKSQGNQINGFEWKVKLAKGINELKAIGMKDSTEIMDNIVINYIESTKN